MNQRVSRNRLGAIAALVGLVVQSWSVAVHEVDAAECRVSLKVTSLLPCAKVPMDPRIDFSALIANSGLIGVLDPNSIRVIDVTGNNEVPCAVTEDFAYGDKGRVEWIIEDPTHTEYEICFRTVAKRPPLRPAAYTPVIGVGDLLRFNAGAPRRIALPRPARLVDLNGDGKRDLVGCWNYAYRPGWPWSGVVSYPRVGHENRFEFGDLVRLRYLIGTEEDRRQQHLAKHHGIPMGDDSGDHKHFASYSTAMQCDFADFNGDGAIDIAFRPWYHGVLQFYLNTGKRDAGGMPVFRGAADVKTEIRRYGNFRAVDLDRDGAVDLVVNDHYLRNKNRDGWPIRLAEPVRLGAGVDACFYDVDADGALDAVGPSVGPEDEPASHRIIWRKNLGGAPPKFGQPELLKDFDDFWYTQVAAVNDGKRRVLLVQHDVREAVSVYEQLPLENGKPRFRKFGLARSRSAVMSLSDQAAPYVCDWDGDGDRDMLIGGGYGWPRIVINDGTNERPAWRAPQYIHSEGKPIRVLIHKVLDAPKYTHRMGYPYPAYVDWDHDGLPDLMLPNESNRIFWYRNIGTRQKPKFGPRLQVICDGYPDSPETRAATGRLIMEKWEGEPDKRSPFGWRRRAAFVDLNGDGLRDLVTQEWEKNRLRLFARYRDEDGTLRLKEDRLLRFQDGEPITEATVLGRTIKNHAGCAMLADWDNDGLLDVIYSFAGWLYDGSIFLLRNIGTRTEPVFEKPRNLKCFGEAIYLTRHGPHPWVGDFDGDHKPDLVCYVEWSVYPFYSHVALTMKQRPTYVLTDPRRRHASARKDSTANARDMSAPAFAVPDNVEAFKAEKARTLKAYWDVVGHPPFNRKPPVNAIVVGQTDAGAYIRKKVRYGNASDDIVWAWLLIPKQISTPTPAIICLPGSFMTPNWGKDAPAGLAGPLTTGNPEAYGRDFALAEYITLCPDYPCAGERTTPGLKSHDTRELDKRFPNWTRMGMSTWDVSRAVDLLLTIPEVDGRRIGCTGWSQGGLTTILGAAMDPRIKVSVSVCGWSPWRGRPLTNMTASYNFPRLRPYVEAKCPLPLDLDQVAALIAPRPLLNINAKEDRYFPNRRILTAAEAEIATYYDSLGAGEKFQALYVAGDHAYSAEVAEASRRWFDRWLRDRP